MSLHWPQVSLGAADMLLATLTPITGDICCHFSCAHSAQEEMAAVISDVNEPEVKPMKLCGEDLAEKVQLFAVRHKRSVVVQVMLMEV